jgi:hypothetical protein
MANPTCYACARCEGIVSRRRSVLGSPSTSPSCGATEGAAVLALHHGPAPFLLHVGPSRSLCSSNRRRFDGIGAHAA